MVRSPTRNEWERLWRWQKPNLCQYPKIHLTTRLDDNPIPPNCDAAVPSTPLQFSRLRNNGFKILTAIISRWRPSATTQHNLVDKYQRFRETCYITPSGSNDLKTEVARLLEDLCPSTRPHGVHSQNIVQLIFADCPQYLPISDPKSPSVITPVTRIHKVK